ncbi:hypothetical protein GGQ62_002667, partial [Polymorphobacter fuscus]|nr:hypothetical protein [Polymorphobacter fuscus]
MQRIASDAVPGHNHPAAPAVARTAMTVIQVVESG